MMWNNVTSEAQEVLKSASEGLLLAAAAMCAYK